MQSILAVIVGLLGIHMLRAAVHRRTLPEAWIGLFFVASALGSETALRALTQTDPALAARLMYAGAPLLTVSTISAYAFIYTVFRRGERWARAIVIAGTVLALWGTWFQLTARGGEPDIGGLSPQFLFGRFVCFAWGTCEAFRAHAMARRRLAFGLADPIVVNRFMLFGAWFAAMGIMPLTLALTRMLGGSAAQTAATGIGPKIIGILMINALVLTFFPPRVYLAWITANAAHASKAVRS